MKTKELINLLKKEKLETKELIRVVNEIRKLDYDITLNIKTTNNTIETSIKGNVNDSDIGILNVIKVLSQILITLMTELKMNKKEKIYCLNKFIGYFIAKSELNEYEEYYISNKN